MFHHGQTLDLLGPINESVCGCDEPDNPRDWPPLVFGVTSEATESLTFPTAGARTETKINRSGATYIWRHRRRCGSAAQELREYGIFMNRYANSD